MHHHHDHPHHDSDHLGDLLDLDPVVLAATTAEVHTWVAALRAGRDTTRVVDLGAGTGAGTFELAARFPDAEVVAVDVDPDRLALLAHRAAERGARVRTHVADLDAGWPALGTPDLVWSALAMHHLGDPDRVLADVRGALALDGTLVVVEMDGDLSFLPAGTPEAELEQRLLDVVARRRDAALPAIGSDWAARIARSGLQVVDRLDLVVDFRPPHAPTTGRYARAWFGRVAPVVEEHLDDADRALLAELIGDGPRALTRRDDLVVAGRRTAWAAAR